MEGNNEEVEQNDEEQVVVTRAQDEDRDPKDRTRVIPVDLSIQYVDSAAYRETYGDSKVWQLYRRNFHKNKTWKPTRENWYGHQSTSLFSRSKLAAFSYMMMIKKKCLNIQISN